MARDYKNGGPCPLCSGTLVEKNETEIFTYKGETFEYTGYIVHECSSCSEQFVGQHTMKASARQLREFYKRVDGLLSSSDIRDIRMRLGLTQDGASDLLGGGGKSFARYENSDVIQSVAMDNLLRILGHNRNELHVIEEKNKPNNVIKIRVKSTFGPQPLQGHMVVNYGR